MFKNSVIIPGVLLLLASCDQRKELTTAHGPSLDSVIIAAERLSDSGFPGEALHLVLNAHSKIDNPSLEEQVSYFSYCNILYNNRKDYDKSIELADSMLWALDVDKTDNPYKSSWRTVAYNSKADALFAKGLYNDAYNYYYLAHKLATENQDSCSLRTYSYSLAMTLYRQRRFRESAHRFIEALEFAAPCPADFNMFYFRQEILDNIGLCYNALKNYDSAMYYYSAALRYINENTGKYPHKLPYVYEAPKAVVYGNLAEVYAHIGKVDSARLLYEHSISINLQKGYTNRDALADQVKLAGLYFNTGDLPNAGRTLANIKAELDTIPDEIVEMLWNKLMWSYLERLGDSVAASRHLRTFVLQNEAYTESNKALMETDLDVRVRDLEKQYKINLLIKDRNQQKVYLVIVTVIALMAVCIVLLVWRNARRSARDVALLKELNNKVNEQKEQLVHALEKLKSKEEDKMRILKSVAHDVMNPIAAIVSLADILLHDADNYTEEQRDVINLIREASTNSLNLSRDILEASEEIDAARLNKENTDIGQLIAKSVELLNFRALSKRQQIIARYPDQPVFALVYKDKMRRVINNILANAIKFSYEDSKIFITLTSQGGEVRVTVVDTGIGIPEKSKPFVFDMFTDEKRAGTSGEAPHGLGLSISRQIARAHNGDIWFESQEGKGSTFHLVFPMDNGDAW